MDPLWSLEVEGFGRIAHARIEQAPLIVLVGKNNSGKSYMASLLWGLMNIRRKLFSSGLMTIASTPNWVRSEVDAFLRERGNAEFDVQYDAICAHIDEIMNDTMFVKEIFSSDAVNLDRANFTVVRDLDRRFFFSESSDYSYLSMGGGEISFGEKALGSDVHRDNLVRHVYRMIVEDFLFNRKLYQGCAYVPAARTGLMLALPALLADLLGELTLSERSSATSFTLPVVEFLKTLLRYQEAQSGSLVQVAEGLEEAVVSGRIVVPSEAAASFRFRTRAMKDSLPLHLASSMITELAPFLALLRSRNGFEALIFEEPEAHLHLSAQREMARALVKIVNLGIPVVITTHSDTFVQQINLLMHLHGHKRRDELMAKFGYEANETLDPEKARAYEFVDDGSGRTVAKELKKEEEGFVVPSLNETLADLAKELYEFDKS